MPVSGFGADRDAFVITLYRELLGRLPTQAELVAAASRLKKAASYKALLKKLTGLPAYRRARKLHHGTGIAPAQAYRDAIAARDRAGSARVAVRIAAAHPRGPRLVGAAAARPGGPIRVALVSEPTGWVAFFGTEASATVADILETASDRFALETTFRDRKEIVGAGQPQVRFFGRTSARSTSASGPSR